MPGQKYVRPKGCAICTDGKTWDRGPWRSETKKKSSFQWHVKEVHPDRLSDWKEIMVELPRKPTPRFQKELDEQSGGFQIFEDGQEGQNEDNGLSVIGVKETRSKKRKERVEDEIPSQAETKKCKRTSTTTTTAAKDETVLSKVAPSSLARASPPLSAPIPIIFEDTKERSKGKASTKRKREDEAELIEDEPKPAKKPKPQPKPKSKSQPKSKKQLAKDRQGALYTSIPDITTPEPEQITALSIIPGSTLKNDNHLYADIDDSAALTGTLGPELQHLATFAFQITNGNTIKLSLENISPQPLDEPRLVPYLIAKSRYFSGRHPVSSSRDMEAPARLSTLFHDASSAPPVTFDLDPDNDQDNFDMKAQAGELGNEIQELVQKAFPTEDGEQIVEIGGEMDEGAVREKTRHVMRYLLAKIKLFREPSMVDRVAVKEPEASTPKRGKRKRSLSTADGLGKGKRWSLVPEKPMTYRSIFEGQDIKR
ncbi:hypothetical protein LTR05_008285 [Lithohypha guttulata]|uniref:Uncharacterized protein n=1 Tax=Lithohypha guttulata TaxID=1690604 RepID=A0AAN7YCX1_9EURO|nr:hypothetical protein LTR05_008285 [Lithohypha guttulata]